MLTFQNLYDLYTTITKDTDTAKFNSLLNYAYI